MKSYRAEIRASWGESEPSARRLAALLGLAPPVTLQHIAERLREVETVSLTLPVHTKDGEPINGHVAMELRSNGEFVFSGHMRATGFPSFHWGVQAWVRSGDGPVIMAQKLGSVFGTDTPGPRQREWTERGTNGGLRSAWRSIRTGASLDYKLHTDVAGVTGALRDVFEFVVTGIIANVPLGPAGWYVLIGNELAGLHKELNSPDVLGGILVGAGSFLVLGPFGLIPAVLAGAATIAVADIHHRRLTDGEIAFAQQIFGSTVRYNDVLVTDLLRPDGKKFCIPFTGNTILMGLGPAAHQDPVRWRNPDPGSSSQQPGQLFVHELTHAWQISTRGPIDVICGMSDDYTYLDDPTWAARDWNSFNFEEQARIVGDWYGRNHNDLGGAAAQGDPAFRFIRDFVRQAIT